MTHVRELQGGAIVTAFGSALGAALKAHDQTLIAYVRFDEAGGTDWLIAFHDETGGGAGEWSSLGKESAALRYYPGPSGADPAGKVWGLAVVTWEQSTNGYHVYFYNFATKELEDLGSGTHLGGLAWAGSEPKRVKFGLWNESEEFNGKYAAAAIFDKTLSSAEIEALAKAASVEAWEGSGPKGLWIFDQKEESEKVVDLMGHGADQGAISQPSTSYVNIEGGLPLPLREGEEGGEEEPPEKNPGAEAPTFIGVKTESGLVTPDRYVMIEPGVLQKL